MQTAHNNRFPGFAPTNKAIVFRANNDSMHWRHLAQPSADVLAWDGVPEELRSECRAAYIEQHDCFGYVVVKVTGRTSQRIPHTGGCYGVRCRVTFVQATEHMGPLVADETVEGWLADFNGEPRW